jgi:putative colanic acid biosynthesis acetyltransferase WcaF
MTERGILDAAKGNIFDGAPSFSLRHRLHRAAFGVVWTLAARWTPPPLHGWRTLVLRAFGARIGPGARVYGSVRVWYPPNLEVGARAVIGPGAILYSMGPMRIGARTIVSQRAHLCGGTHAIDDPNFQLLARPIEIGNDAWIAAESFVAPGVSVGEGAVLGARAVAVRDVAPWTVHGGNPARKLRDRQRFDRESA